MNSPGQCPLARTNPEGSATRGSPKATGQAVVNLLDWLIHGGQAYAAAQGYVPLPAQVEQLAHTMLQKITGLNGEHLLG